ncbi:MAG: hypothetical protein ACI8QZ_001992 [Chlamydiales bacterium]|jgi:hypothetical protein
MIRAPWSLLCLLLVACGGEGTEGVVEAAEVRLDPAPSAPIDAVAAMAAVAEDSALPEIEILDPDDPIVLLKPSEILTVSVQDWVHALAEKIAIRDLAGAAAWFRGDFLGRDAFGTAPVDQVRLPLDAVRQRYEPEDFAFVDGAGFLAGLDRRIGSWRRVLQSEWRVTQAEFQSGDVVRWGKVHLHVRLTGMTASGGRADVDARFVARVENVQQGWRFSLLDVLELTSSRKRDPLFVDVSRATGISHEGIRYGQPGNDNDAWNGVASGDFDGDGRYDIFVPSSERNFLYRNRGDGSFDEVAEASGVLGNGGGTGALFFDVDNDGDQDLVVGHVGALGTARELVGDTAHLYRNDGAGHFEDITLGSGLDVAQVAYSLTAFDHDGDGFVDLFMCGYGRMEVARNNSWIESTNGSPNRLLRNVDGEHFEDVTKSAGLDDWRWSYQAAAADYDGDGHIDLYVANNFGSNRLYRNLGDGTFMDVAGKLGVAERGNSMAVSWADMNNDGRLDLFVAGPTSVTGERVLKRVRRGGEERVADDLLNLASGNALFFGTESGGFERAPRGYGGANAGWVWSSALADLDLDGALDIFCVNGFVTGDLPQDT